MKKNIKKNIWIVLTICTTSIGLVWGFFDYFNDIIYCSYTLEEYPVIFVRLCNEVGSISNLIIYTLGSGSMGLLLAYIVKWLATRSKKNHD
jgi:hypothetical protein